MTTKSVDSVDSEWLKERLKHPQGKVRMVLDTDTYNEIDDQFAVAYALSSPEKLSVEAIYAAPFHNSRSTGPADGMEKSFDEIVRVLDRLSVSMEGKLFRGSREFLSDLSRPVRSQAADDLVARAMAASADDPLYVVSIGAITNVASALLLEPRIRERIVVVWLGGHALHWSDTKEFNLKQDVLAARHVLDCGVPLALVPCLGVTSHLLTTLPETEAYLRDAGAIGDYLIELVRGYQGNKYAYSKVIWDIAAIAFLLDEKFVDTQWVPSPILQDDVTWGTDAARHPICYVRALRRDLIFGDLFRKLIARCK
jgi:inosine-uridine nucleoside N-ribohydrolase